MGIVRFALRFPHTFYVLAALIVFLGVTAIRTMPTDIFPQINIPVVTVIWSYTGLSTPEMEQRVTTYSQYSISSNVNGIKDMEAQTLNGISVQKIYFQPDVNLDLAIAQIVSATNAIRALMPPGIQPPIVVQFNASSVPVLQLSLTSDNLNEQQLYDYGIYRLRQQLAPVPGVTFPTPAGGKYRQIMVDIDPAKLLASGLTPLDVVNAVNAQNLTLPSGHGEDRQHAIHRAHQRHAGYHRRAQQYSGQVHQRRDGVHQGRRPGPRRLGGAAEHRPRGRRARRSAQRHQERQRFDPRCRQRGTQRAAGRPRRGPARPQDQRAVRPVGVRQIGRWRAWCARARSPPALTALMILLFLGSWRSTLVVMISIPLAILTSLVVLYFLGETLNTMTLGGLALAVGILVDDSTVTIENTHRLLTEERMPLAAGDAARLGRHRRADPGLDARHQLRVHLGASSSRDRRSICSRRSASPWCSPCWPPTACRAR